MPHFAIKYRAYPTPEQQAFFAKTFGCCRFIWNRMLADKKDHYQKTKKALQTTPAQYKDDFPFLREVDSLALANVQLQLQTAYTAFFKQKKVAFPKFKSKKHGRKSYTTNNQDGTITLENGYLKLPKVKRVKIKLHRHPEPDWRLKSATISQAPDGKYYISVLFEYEAVITPVAPTTVLGLDYASAELYVDSDGNAPAYERRYRQGETRLAKRQRQLSKKKKGSNNYCKAKQKVAKRHAKVANQRLDFLHKQSRKIANSVDVVCVEDLDMKAMSRSLRLGKSTMDNGFGLFRSLLAYKLANQGKYVVVIDKWYPSSQLCNECGHRNPGTKDLAVRAWTCSACGHTHDRDVNAARNIRDEGLRILKQQLAA